MRPATSSLRVTLRRLPVLIGAALLGVSWFYLMWNTTVGELAPALRFKTKQTIAGVIDQAAATLTVPNILNYSFQRGVSEAIGRLSPVFGTAIHWKGQIYFSLLGMSAHPAVVVGSHGQLLQQIYVTEYCSRDSARFRPKAEAWAHAIREMQDYYRSRGVVFLYFITPSKVAIDPSTIPAEQHCLSGAGDRADKLPIMRAALDRAGIEYVDAATLVEQASKTAGIPMFPRGGIHWNTLASALGAQALARKLNEIAGADTITPFEISWTRSSSPQGSDRDLVELLNLVWPDYTYEVPATTITSGPRPPSCRPARIGEVTGSFMFLANTALARTACPPDIQDWWYFNDRHFHYPPPKGDESDIDPAARDAALTGGLPIIILEENEANMPFAAHGLDLYKMLFGHLPAGAS